MEKLPDAIKQVKESLMRGQSVQEAISEAAQDYDFAEPWLYRRFTVAHASVTPEEWIAGYQKRMKAAEDMAVASRQRAIDKAKELATVKWRAQGALAELAGRVFCVGKREYAYVVFGSDNPAFAVRAISLETGRIQTFPASKMPDIAKQIAPQMALAL